jgi:hypothetical protein
MAQRIRLRNGRRWWGRARGGRFEMGDECGYGRYMAYRRKTCGGSYGDCL